MKGYNRNFAQHGVGLPVAGVAVNTHKINRDKKVCDNGLELSKKASLPFRSFELSTNICKRGTVIQKNIFGVKDGDM